MSSGRALLLLLILQSSAVPSAGQAGDSDGDQPIRVATFNVSLYRRNAGDLLTDLQEGSHPQARKLAQIIRAVRPQILLLNEFDYSRDAEAARLFAHLYLEANEEQYANAPMVYPYIWQPECNTGVASGRDLNKDGAIDGAPDAFGFGWFPGQYGMIVLSQFPIDEAEVRTFSRFLWKDLPNARLPVGENGNNWYSDGDLDVFRLSSKTHAIVPITTPQGRLNFIVCHPTPPVFDGPEDRNGLRNHDEIQLLRELVESPDANWLKDDKGRRGGLPAGGAFVIAGDLNADPNDGDEVVREGITALLNSSRIQADPVPESAGAIEAAEQQGRANLKHRGPSNQDTADFGDRSPGNLRVDHLLPSRECTVHANGVFWPTGGSPGQAWIDASDHRLVWADLSIGVTGSVSEATDGGN